MVTEGVRPYRPDFLNYLELMITGKMTNEELNKIQDAQQVAYEYMIGCSLRLNDRQFHRQTKETLDFQKVIDIKSKSLRSISIII